MKCFTVTEKGVTPGIAFVTEPYAHVGVGDPKAEIDYRRVKIDDAVAGGASNKTLSACSLTLDPNDDDRRRASYTIVPPSGSDDDQAMVKIEIRSPKAGGRTGYELPRQTFAVASGWISDKDPGGPVGATPSNLVVVKKGTAIRVFEATDPTKHPQALYDIAFDGSSLTVKK